MAKKLELNLPSADDLFSSQESREDSSREKVYDIPLAEIDDFPEHPFQVRKDDELDAMIDSVQRKGILTPILVRQKKDGRYELISGHRRKLASELAGKDTIPSIIRSMNRDEAIVLMVDSNLQREKILPSEKAFAYKMRLDAMKRQGNRSDLTSDPLGQKLKSKYSVDVLGEQVGESKNQIQRYIRLTELIPDILKMVDDSVIKMRPAVELSYISKDEQADLHRIMEEEASTPSYAQAIKLREFSQSGKLSCDVMQSIIQEEKPNQTEKIKLPYERIRKYFKAGTPAKAMEDTIVKALELYRKRQRDKDAR